MEVLLSLFGFLFCFLFPLPLVGQFAQWLDECIPGERFSFFPLHFFFDMV